MPQNKMTGNIWEPSEEQCDVLLKRLIRTDTCQPAGNEEGLVDFIIGRLPKDAEYTKLDHGQGRASLVVELRGEPKSGGWPEDGGAALIGHLDTVACGREEEWKYPPLEAYTEDGVMYGRGTADMKGGVAAMILAMEKLWEERHLLEKSVYFCFTADEEYKGLGIQMIAETGLLSGVEEVIICEPSDEQISICEKGAVWLSALVKGAAAHASRPELGINAAEIAYAFAGRMKRYLESAREHPILGRASVSVTKIKSGIMTNMIPPEAEIVLDIRTVPGISCDEVKEHAEKIRQALQAEHPGAGISIETLNCRPAVGTKESDEKVKRILSLAQEMGLSGIPRGTHFYTDASQLIPILPVPFVIAGPGDDRQAHCTDEHVEIGSVARFAAFYRQYIADHYMSCL